MAKAAKLTKMASRSTRFAPDAGTMAGLAFQREGEKALVLYGLVLNESATGFAAVVLTKEEIKKGTPCLCRVGKLPMTNATVRWVKDLEKGILKVGLQYQD